MFVRHFLNKKQHSYSPAQNPQIKLQIIPNCFDSAIVDSNNNCSQKKTL